MALELKNIDFKNFSLRDIYEWPIYGRMVIFMLVSIGVFYFGYIFDFSSLSNQILTRFKQEQDLKQQLESSLKIEEEMREVVLQYPEVMKLLNQWQGQLISSSTLPDLMNLILSIGATNHLKFSVFIPGEKKPVEDYFMVPIKVVVQGNYNQVAHFISQVANLPQLVAIGDFAMMKQNEAKDSGEKESESNAANGNLTTALTLEVYYLANKK